MAHWKKLSPHGCRTARFLRSKVGNLRGKVDAFGAKRAVWEPAKRLRKPTEPRCQPAPLSPSILSFIFFFFWPFLHRHHHESISTSTAHNEKQQCGINNKHIRLTPIAAVVLRFPPEVRRHSFCPFAALLLSYWYRGCTHGEGATLI